ncbi:MAG: putative sulfate exporter family transporter, partial [Burkholderiales bacterium]
MTRLQLWGRQHWSGLVLCLVVALAALSLSEHHQAPAFLLALLLGMALNSLSRETACGPGIDFTARQVLRIGVALLGLRITLDQVL